MKKLILLVCVLCTVQIAFAQNKSMKKTNYGQNLVTVSPFHGYASPQVSDIALSLGYERFINEYFAVKVPLNLGIINNLIQSGVSAKFYPFGHERPVKYAIAPTIQIGNARNEFENLVFDPISGQSFWQITTQNIFQIGFTLNSSLNITINERIYIGAETGLGINYINRIKTENQAVRNENPNAAFLFNIGLGYRF